MKKITIVTPCYNEEDNIEELIRRVKISIADINAYAFEILVIDNKSTDRTREILRRIAHEDRSVKVIFNTRNFGHIRSPYYGILASQGDATIYLASDLQDPPEMIPNLIKYWEQGYKLVLATKPVSKENMFMHKLRVAYYRLLDKISTIDVIKDSTGFGLYDQVVIQNLREIDDPYPFLRGLISELGYEAKLIEFEQPRRMRGISKNNFYTLYDIAILGIISHSLVPIRIGGLLGFAIGISSIIAAFIFLILKILYWNEYPIGSAPIVIGLFFLFGIQLCFLALIGEYIGAIHTYVQKRPVVVEEQRINF